MSNITIRPITEADRDWVRRFVTERWGDTRMVSRGVVHAIDALPGFVASEQGNPVGLGTYRIQGQACEITSLDSTSERRGVGTALIEAIKKVAQQAGCQRLWLITTNDNTHALRFYQKRGFELVALHRNAMEDARKLKPQIPLIGNDGIPLRDEIELEIKLEIR